MRRLLAVLLIGFAPIMAAAQDDGWVGVIVFPKTSMVELYAVDGTSLGFWRSSPGRVAKITPDGKAEIQNLYAPGTSRMWAKRTDVVKLADAVRHFSMHIQADPEDSWGYEMRGEAYGELGDHAKAARDLTEAIRLNPSANSYVNRGNRRVALGDRAGAITDYTAAIRLDPKNYHGFNNRANEYYLSGDFAKAESDFAAAIRLQPTNPVAFNNRGLMWDRKQEYEKAVADFTGAIRLNKAFAEPYANRANTRLAKQDYPSAVTDYSEAIRLEPKNHNYYYGRGYAHELTKEYDKAVTDYTEAGRLGATDPRPFLGLGEVWRRRDPDKAITAYTEAIRRDPKSDYSFHRRGGTWEVKQEYEKAAADYTEAIRLNPKYEFSYNALAWIRATCPDAKHRDGAKAVELATTLCDLSRGKNADHLDTLAAAHAEVGDFDKAVEAQKKALAIPGLTEADTRVYRERLKLYETGMPFRQAPPAKKD